MSITRQAVTRLTLDLGLPNCQTSAAIHKGDKNRRWEITVIDEGKPFLLPDTWTVVLAGVKPDGTSLYNGCVVDDGKIVYDFASGPQIATCEGTFPVQFDVFDEEGELVATPKVWVNCYPTLREQVEDVDSTDEFSAISQFIAQKNELQAQMDQLASLLGNPAIKTQIMSISAGNWSDSTPHEAFAYVGGNENSTILLIPVDVETRRISQEINLEVDSTMAFPWGSVMINFKKDGDSPDKDLAYVALVFTADTVPEGFKATATFVGMCTPE